MNPAEMIVLIILIVTIGRVLSSRKRGGTIDTVVDKLEPGGASAADAERMRAEIHRLNDRLAVLERIATDPAKRLSDEIDSLKHK